MSMRELEFQMKCYLKISALLEVWFELGKDEFSLSTDFIHEKEDHSHVAFIRIHCESISDMNSMCFLCSEHGLQNDIHLEWLNSME